MKVLRAGLVALAVVLGAALATPPVAEAKKTEEYAYRFEQVWSASVRMVRVDLRFPITDRDESIGYVLFEYRDGDRSYPGSVELVRVREGRREKIRVAIQIQQMPSYIEQMLVDRLSRKLRDEFGEPPPAPPEREPEGDGNEGDEGEEDAEEEG